MGLFLYLLVGAAVVYGARQLGAFDGGDDDDIPKAIAAMFLGLLWPVALLLGLFCFGASALGRWLGRE